MVQRVQLLTQLREELAAELQKLTIVQEIFPSAANFLLVRFADPQIAAAVMAATRSAGLVLRDRGGEAGLQGCVRISIGSEPQNHRLLEVLREVRP